MVRNTNPFSTGTIADSIGLSAASVVGETEAVSELDVAGLIVEPPSLIVPAWESDQHRLTLIASPIPMDHLMIRV